MKAVIDSGTMITLSMTCLMNIFRNFVKENKLELLISKDVARESVWKPIENKRFSLSAARIKKAIGDGTVTVVPRSKDITDMENKILAIANSIYCCSDEKGRPITIIQAGEAEALALTRAFNTKIMFVDERTTRSLIENPLRLKQILERRQKMKVSINREKLKEFKAMFSDVRIFRSIDIIAVAYEQGLFDSELEHGELELEAALFAAKYSGCAASETEIREYLKSPKLVNIRQ